jgi:hypothetical protein
MVMQAEHRQNRRGGLSLARRDLSADWRGWSIPERMSALAAVAVLVVAPVLLLSGFPPG